MGLIGYLHMNDNAWLDKFYPGFGEAQRAIKDRTNPRFIWVIGPGVWRTPVDKGGGQEAVLKLYEQALLKVRSSKKSDNPLEPRWGEAELLMSLAYTHLNKEKPDLPAAESHARAALKLVPHWHYVKDILMPQIAKAKGGR